MLDVDGEVALLVDAITRLGAPDPAGAATVSVPFGVLFRETGDIFEALVGTLRAAKKRGIIAFEGELLLQGVHDAVPVTLLKNKQAE